MHPWPQIGRINLSNSLEHWELHGIREWAYRRALYDERERAAVGTYIAHRALPTLCEHYQQELSVSFGAVDIPQQEKLRFSVYNTFRQVAALLGTPGGPGILDFNYAFADKQSYVSFQKPGLQHALIFDGRRIPSCYGTLPEGSAAVFRGGFNKGLHSQPLAPDYHERVQRGAEIVHDAFEQPYRMGCSIPLLELIEVFRRIKATAPMQVATVNEAAANSVDTSIRSSNISWIPYEKHPRLHAALEKALFSIFRVATPQFLSLDELHKPPLQYTRYGPGSYYNWHTDGSYDQFVNRRLSFTLLLQAAEEGGELEFEDGVVPLFPGNLVVFPSYKRHRVTEVKRGERHSLVGWFEKSPAPVAEDDRSS